MDPGSRQFGGRYRVDRPLGEGGVGVVFQATDVSTGRTVALKLLRSTDLGDEASQRFAREAAIVQRLTHPNTVRLYDFGTESDGSQYIVYELLQGETLSHVIRQGPVAADRTIHIAIQVLKALHEAHQLGVVHRDIKPGNIMLLQFAGDRDVVKLLDFGIAKPTTNATHALTNTGVLIGTPRFMSPEQVRGDPVGPPSDLYSLALVLAELLSAQRVLEGSSMDILLAHIAPEQLVLPPVVASGPLGAVLGRALEKDVRRRYANALEMLADLEALAARMSLQPPGSTWNPGNVSDGTTTHVQGPPSAAQRVDPSTQFIGPYSTGSASYQMGAPVPVNAPQAPAPAPHPVLPWLIAGSALALLLVGGGAAGAFWYLSLRSSPTASGVSIPGGSPAPTSALASPGADARIANMRTGLATFDWQGASSFLVSQGWKALPRISDTSCAFLKDGKMMSFTWSVNTRPNVTALQALALARKHPVAIFGNTVVFFQVFQGRKQIPAESGSWRDRIVKYLKQHAR